MFKKIIPVICASVFAFAFNCFEFNVNATENESLIYPVKVVWEATSNTDGTEPIMGQIDANIIISDDRNSVKLVVTQDFQAWFPIKISNSLDDFIDIKYNKVVKTSDMKKSNNKSNKNSEYFYYIPANYKDGSGYYLVNDVTFNKSDTFSAGSIIPAGYVLYELYGGNGMKYFMKSTEEVFYGDEKDQYIKQLEEENSKLKTEIESYKKLDFDGDGLLTSADAQMILNYYVDFLANGTSGKIEDYPEYLYSRYYF